MSDQDRREIAVMRQRLRDLQRRERELAARIQRIGSRWEA